MHKQNVKIKKKLKKISNNQNINEITQNQMQTFQTFRQPPAASGKYARLFIEIIEIRYVYILFSKCAGVCKQAKASA